MTPALMDSDIEKKEEKISLPYSSPGSHEIKVGVGVAVLKAEVLEEAPILASKPVVSGEECVAKEEQKSGEKQKPFKCEDCGKCFSQLRNYKYHRCVKIYYMVCLLCPLKWFMNFYEVFWFFLLLYWF